MHVSHDYYFLSVFQNTLISEWKSRVDELKMENDYQWRLKNMKYEEQVKDLTDKYMLELELLRMQIMIEMNKQYISELHVMHYNYRV